MKLLFPNVLSLRVGIIAWFFGLPGLFLSSLLFVHCYPQVTMSDMSTESTTFQNTPSSKKPADPIMTNADSHSVQITTIRLNGDNFLRWSQAVRMYIKGRGMMGYLTGETKAPPETDPAYATWDAGNSMVMMWLVNSMEEDISSNYMRTFQRDLGLN